LPKATAIAVARSTSLAGLLAAHRLALEIRQHILQVAGMIAADTSQNFHDSFGLFDYV
jgi:hypothetical protein